MRDRAVRRRRATLAAFVVASLVLLTAYFGESGGGALHSVQRGFVDVLNPIQEGASRALKPFRDLFGWAGETLDAKEERDKLRKENADLINSVAELEKAHGENTELRQLVELNDEGISAYSPVIARITGRNPSVWYSTLTINRGRNDGIRVDMPVVAANDAKAARRTGGALVGRVSAVGAGTAQVKLITDSGFAVSARTTRSREPGVLEAEVGSGRELVFSPIRGAEEIRRGERLITAGTVSNSRDLQSLFPPGIPIGRVRSIDEGEGPLTRVIKVEPAADLRRMEFVQVLVKPRTGTQTARVGTP